MRTKPHNSPFSAALECLIHSIQVYAAWLLISSYGSARCNIELTTTPTLSSIDNLTIWNILFARLTNLQRCGNSLFDTSEHSSNYLNSPRTLTSVISIHHIKQSLYPFERETLFYRLQNSKLEANILEKITPIEMPQVVSKNLRPGNDGPAWKRPLTISLHGLAATTYGFATCWQSVSESSAILYTKTNPAMRVFGRWRFLTYQCLIIQFVAYSLCLATHLEPRLRRSRDFFFTTFALPIGTLVVLSFWTVWAVAGRESIFPIALEPYYPPWLNHITHTIILPINLLELCLVRHTHPSERKSFIILSTYVASYTSFLLYIRWQTGRFVYPFLNKMDAVPAGLFIVGMYFVAIIAQKSGRAINNFIHKTKS